MNFGNTYKAHDSAVSKGVQSVPRKYYPHHHQYTSQAELLIQGRMVYAFMLFMSDFEPAI